MAARRRAVLGWKEPLNAAAANVSPKTLNFESFENDIDDPIGIAHALPPMPRAITRLRYRTPPSPATFFNRLGQPVTGAALEQRVAKYVAQQSNPRHIKLQIVANPKARLPAPGKTIVQPHKPFTLKDVVDPEGRAQHGQIIYIFRNVKTNQIIYSLQELLKVCIDIHEVPQWL